MKVFFLIFLSVSVLFFGLTGCKDSGGNSDNPAGPDNNNNNNSASWTTDTITTGEYPSIALDADGNPHISFLDYNDGLVKYAFRDGDNWTIEPVGKVSNSNGTYANGGVTSIALDAQDNPYISYYDYGSVQFKLAAKTASSWNIATIPLPNDPKMSYDSPFIPWAESSVAIDQQNGTVHMAVQMLGGLSGFVMGYWRSGMTAALIVDDSDGQTGYNNSIALDSKGWPAISYEARGSGELKYAKWNGSGFDKEIVAPMPDIYWMDHLSALGFNSADVACVAFYGQGGYKYAMKNGTSWTAKDMAFQSGYPALSLCANGSDVPQIAIVTIDTGNSYRLKRAWLNGSDWSYDNIEDNIECCSIATSPAGKIGIAYETDRGVLKYAFK